MSSFSTHGHTSRGNTKHHFTESLLFDSQRTLTSTREYLTDSEVDWLMKAAVKPEEPASRPNSYPCHVPPWFRVAEVREKAIGNLSD